MVPFWAELCGRDDRQTQWKDDRQTSVAGMTDRPLQQALSALPLSLLFRTDLLNFPAGAH